MKKLFSFVAAALLSVAMMAGANDLLWDYTEKAPGSSPDNGLYYAGSVNDAAGTNNGLKGIKLNSSGYAYFTKAAVAGTLKLTYGPRSGSSKSSLKIETWEGDAASSTKPTSLTQIASTAELTESGTVRVELTADQNNIFIERLANVETVLQKIQFTEFVPRTFTDFKIEFRENPYTVLLPESGELPAGVTVTGTTYNGDQHGVQGGVITVPVDGPVKFTIGACHYSNTPIKVQKDGEDYTTVSNNAPCGERPGSYAQNIVYIYTGEASTLTFTLANNTYVPYFFAEATEITPCELIYKDQNGVVLGKFETYEGAELVTIPYDENDLTIPEGNAFRGWFYSNGKKAKEGDIITGNTTIQAKVTPIEVATVGSVQTYDFASAIFYPEDHETVTASGGAFHDGTHGWYFNADGSIGVQVAGNAVVVVTLCKYSETGDIIVTDTYNSNGVAQFALTKNETADGTEFSARYKGEATTLTISWTAKQYIHKVVVYNVLDFLEKNETTGYYIVPSGDVASFLLALVQAEAGDKIFLPNGVYDLGETVLTTIGKNNISIIGQSEEGTIVKNAPDASTESIDKTATIKIDKNVSGTYLQDLTIQNALDYYKNDNGRAVALWDQGTKTICKNVCLLSYQDTYYSNLQGAVKFFDDCEIHGTVDFICGDGSVYFRNNLLYAEKRKKDGGGSDALTANNGPATDKGYVFDACTIQSECPVVSLGRAWNNTPSVAFINCVADFSKGQFGFESSDIQRWTKKLMNPNAWPQFGEYNLRDTEGNLLTPESNVVTFLDEKSNNATREIETVLTEEQAAVYTVENTLGDWAATAEADAKQAEADLVNIDDDGIYLVETEEGCEIVKGSELTEVAEGASIRKANARGGFGKSAGKNQPEAVENVESEASRATKIFRNGQLVIIRDGKTYNALGAQL